MLKITEVMYTTMIFVAYRTSLDMFCDVKPNFSQLLKAHVYDGRLAILIFIFLMKKCLPAKKEKKKKTFN